eukprot:TRINITY_DN31772_c0_g1_i1.p1 TRINITY_DN31772_c0_g1~~TRINITY_DN31772_c0_g1_i1.p1  ORF type:complete len:120 (-),score=25.86 TRINITY_DN31772_c0_g1_i1:57-383(-)
MGVQLWMIMAGLVLIFHAGSTIMAEKRAAMEAASRSMEEVGVSSQVFLEVVIGAFLALWGGIAEFKPIKLGDSKKPRWESLHARQDFHSYRSRARFMRPLLTNVPSPP